MKPDSELIHYVLEQIEKLEHYIVGKGEKDFSEDELLYDGCAMKVLVIGEYASKLSRGFKAANPKIEWSLMKAARNFYAHDYGDLTPARIWKTITEEIPVLKEQFNTILEKEDNATNQ